MVLLVEKWLDVIRSQEQAMSGQPDNNNNRVYRQQRCQVLVLDIVFYLSLQKRSVRIYMSIGFSNNTSHVKMSYEE